MLSYLEATNKCRGEATDDFSAKTQFPVPPPITERFPYEFLIEYIPRNTSTCISDSKGHILLNRFEMTRKENFVCNQMMIDYLIVEHGKLCYSSQNGCLTLHL